MILKHYNDMPFKSNPMGIYLILNVIENKYYIGSSVNILSRIRSHLLDLDKNIHCNYKLQNSYNKYGKESFSFWILELVDNIDDLKIIEYNWLSILKPYIYDYNIAKKPEGITKFSEETKRKMSQSAKGKRTSLETKEKLRKFNIEYRKNNPQDRDILKRMSDASKAYYQFYNKLKIENPEEFSKIEIVPKNSISINKISLDGVTVSKFRSISEAARSENIVHSRMRTIISKKQVFNNHLWKLAIG